MSPVVEVFILASDARHDPTMHYGQVVSITKQLRAVNLGFYRELDATGRATSGS